MHIPVNTVARIISAAEESVKTVIPYLADHGITDRTGGCFAFGVRYTARMVRNVPSPGYYTQEVCVPALICCPLLVVPAVKLVKYSGYAVEKNARLITTSVKPRWLESSWESRDEPAQLWGGAIHASAPTQYEASLDISSGTVLEAFFSFSGLPEKGDEAAMLLTARKLGCVFEEDRIITASDNEIARALLK